MPDEDCILETKFVADIDNVVRVSGKRRLCLRIVGFQVRPTRADMVEKDSLKPGLERWRHMPPHVLVAAKSMREHHGGAGPGSANIVTNYRGH
jgi:hypothetical protein